MSGRRGSSQPPGGERGALNTNLPHLVMINSAVLLVGGKKKPKQLREAFLTGIQAHEEQQQLLGKEK